ncbi:hypothetical protein ABBQ38_004185 [Trebouxia sp. C0009 RCD-2024]
MFNSLRTAAAKFTRSSGSGRQSSTNDDARESGAQVTDQIASAEQADTLGNFQSFPRRSSISRDKGRNSVEGSKPHGCTSSSGSKSPETATSHGERPFSNVATKSLLDAGPRSSGVSSDTAYAARPGQQSDPDRFYQGTEGSWMSLQSLQSSLADEPMHAASSSKSALNGQASLDIPAAAAGPEKREGIDRLEEEAARQQESHQQSCSDMPMRISGDASSGNAANAMRSSKDGEMSFKRPSGKPPKGSVESTTSSSGTNAHSQRSSFAMERASLDAKHSSLEMFTHAPPQQGSSVEAGYQNLEAACRQMGIPKAMCDRYMRLAVVPDNTPLPMTMLSKLWQLPGLREAEDSANLLQQMGIMRVAFLYDGSAWALVDTGHLKHLQGQAWSGAADVHEELLQSYLAGRQQLAEVQDDGYFMQNVGHHLVAAKRFRGLKALLTNAAWLESKLHSYGVASVVADYRRYLMCVNDDQVKLMLETVQMSVSSCMQHPELPTLRPQMVGRLMAAHHSSRVASWLAQQQQQMQTSSNIARPLMPRTASLEQAGGLHRMVLRGHTGPIRKVLLTPGGTEVVTASADGSARVWDMEIGDCVLLLEGHTAAVTGVAVAQEGSLLVTCSADHTARVWGLDKGQCKAVLQGHTAAINAVAVDTRGRFAVTASADATGRVWDLHSGQCAHVLRGHGAGAAGAGSLIAGAVWSVALTPDGRRVLTASEDFTARVWDVVSGNCAHVLDGHTGWVVHVCTTQDGLRCATASHDGTARIWKIAEGECEQVLEGHAGRVNSVQLCDVNQTAMTVSDDFTARVWNWSTGQCLHVLEGHGGWVSDMAMLSNASRAVTVSGDDLAVVWNLQEGKCCNVLEGHSAEASSVVLTRRGRFAITGSEDSTARVWDLQAPPLLDDRNHAGKVHCMSVTPDGATAVSVAADGCAMVWDVQSGSCRHTLKGHATALHWASLASDGRTLLTVAGDRSIKAWDIESGSCGATLPNHAGYRVKSFAASADCRLAVIVLFDSTVAVWDMVNMECSCMLQSWGDRDAARVHSAGVNAAYLSPTGSRAVTVSGDHTARVWDIATAECRCVLRGHEDSISMGCLDAAGRRLLTIAFDKTARVWDIRSGRCLAVLQHRQQLIRGSMAPHGHTVVTVTAQHVAHLWDVRSGQLLHSFEGHKEDVTHVAFSRDSLWVATCSTDCTARLWSVHSSQLQGFFMADSSLTHCIFAGPPQKQDSLLVSSDNGSIHFLQL